MNWPDIIKVHTNDYFGGVDIDDENPITMDYVSKKLDFQAYTRHVNNYGVSGFHRKNVGFDVLIRLPVIDDGRSFDMYIFGEIKSNTDKETMEEVKQKWKQDGNFDALNTKLSTPLNKVGKQYNSISTIIKAADAYHGNNEPIHDQSQYCGYFYYTFHQGPNENLPSIFSAPCGVMSALGGVPFGSFLQRTIFEFEKKLVDA